MNSFPDTPQKASRENVVRIVISVLAIFICLIIITEAAQFGFSRLLARYALVAKSIPAAAEAVSLTPSDADAHRALAVSFRNVQMFQEASKEFEIAASLRPNDDYVWLELGMLRDELNDSEGALSAFDQAVTQAPYYAHTRWQRANLRLRMGRYDEAFAELREAAKSNRTFLPSLIDLAWGLSRQDAKLTEQLAGIDSPDSRVAFTRFLASKGKGKETREQFAQAAQFFSVEQKRELLRALLEVHAYRDAFGIWKGSGELSNNDLQIHDGGFEGTISLSEVGFGWNISRQLSKVEASQDTSDKDSGDKSLRIAFDGDSPTAAVVVSQTIIVKPQTRYRISFAVKAKDIISGGLPLLRVVDAGTNVMLAQSGSLPQNSEWQKQVIEFTSPSLCDAIVLKLARNECTSSPCPTFGVIWLDSFSIEEMKL